MTENINGNGVVVGIGEYAVSKNPNDVIKTFALGSCVAVIIYDKIKQIAGLIHIALPESKIAVEKSEKLPGYFADTGLPLFLEDFRKKGGMLTNSWIKLAGGANVLNSSYNFDIGTRNVLAIKKYLWKYNLGIISEDTGGIMGRKLIYFSEQNEIFVAKLQKIRSTDYYSK